MQPLTEQPQYSSQDHPLAIHIGKVLEEKAGKRLPPFALRLLERIIHQREINDILYRYGHLDGMDFLEALMGEFAVTTEWVHPERLPESGRCIFVCNHPLGGMDGISLSYMLGKRYGDVRYMVTDFLYYLRPLQSVFLPVNNRQGSQGRESITMLQEAIRSDVPIGTFPQAHAHVSSTASCRTALGIRPSSRRPSLTSATSCRCTMSGRIAATSTGSGTSRRR